MSVQATASTLSESPLLDAVRAPLPNGGEDPRYSDELLQAKREIDKLKKNNYTLAHKLCCELLARQGKDLRVAGYLLMAALGRDGLPGLLEAAEGYRYLLEHFWDACHPRKDSQRLGALSWLNGARLESMARDAGRTATVEEMNQLRRCVDEINSLLRARLGDESPQWRTLDGWLKAKPPTPQIVSASVPQATEVPATPCAPVPEEPAPQPTAKEEPLVSSEREAFAMTRTLSNYFREQGNWRQALAFTRALRWGALVLPPHEQGRTRVPAPRASALSALENQRQTGDPAALLQLCEALFLEPGGQFWLDLQYLSRQAAKASGRDDLQNFIEDQTQILLRRLPALVALCFDDGRPFADPATRGWLEDLCAEGERQPEVAARDAWDEQLALVLKTARDLAAQKKLSDALDLLRDLPAQTETRRLRLHLAQTALCLQGGRPDVALHLAEVLEEQVDALHVVLWDQPLALEIWRLALDTLQQCVRKAPTEEKAAMEIKIHRLRAQICRTDPAAAVKWL